MPIASASELICNLQRFQRCAQNVDLTLQKYGPTKNVEPPQNVDTKFVYPPKTIPPDLNSTIIGEPRTIG